MRLSNSLLTEIALVGVGAYKTYNDYKNSPKEQRSRTLFRNIVTIGACSAAIFKMDSFLSKAVSGEKIHNGLKTVVKPLKTPLIKNFSKKVAKFLKTPEVKMEAVANIISDCTKCFVINMTGLLAGVGIGKTIDKLVFKDIQKISKNNKKNQNAEVQPYVNPLEKLLVSTKPGQIIINDTTKDVFLTTTKIFEEAGFIKNPLTKPMLIMDNLELSKEKSVKKVLEQSTTGILVETIVPTTMLSLAHTFTKNTKLQKRLPILAATILSGTYIADKIGNMMNHEIVQKENSANTRML